MWRPLIASATLATMGHRLAVASNDRAVANARAASTELSRLRVERAEVELWLAARGRDAGVPAATEGRPA